MSDDFGATSVSSGDLTSGGIFTWTPTSNDIGEHDLTILVNDNSGDTAMLTQTITVTAPTSLAIQSLSPGSSVNSGQAVDLYRLVPTGLTSPVYTVSDNFSG